MAALLMALCAANAATAQQIKPLDVEQDANGVDLLSGRVSPRVPVLSIPAAPNLSLGQLSEFLPALEGLLIPNTPGRATYNVNGGGVSSERFACDDQGYCRAVRGNGAHITPEPSVPEVMYYEGGTGRMIAFTVRNGPQGTVASGTAFYLLPSTVTYPSGETLTFSYDTATPVAGQIWHRPSSVVSSLGYTLTLTYQGNVYGQFGWSELVQATITQSSVPSTPLARLTYAGNTVTDLAGRQWTCVDCRFSLVDTGMTAVTAARLPTETINAFQTFADNRTYGSVTHANWVTRVSNDGVNWDYSYVPGPTPQTQINQVTITAPLGFSRTVNIANPSQGRPRITATADSLGRTTSYQYDNEVRITRIVRPQGNAEAVVYDELGNITERRLIAMPGSGLADIVETAYYGNHQPASGDLCYWAACFQPLWTRDALLRQTDYTWSANGNLLTRLEPADANGQRRLTINEYDGQNRLLRERTCLANASGTPLTCGTAAEQVRAFTYWNNTRLPLTETVTDGTSSQSLTTIHSYDAAGRRLSSDGPLPGTDDASYSRYDIIGRRTWEIGPLGANGRRSATRTTYRDSDDRPVIVEVGHIANATSTDLTVVTRTDLVYDSVRNPSRETVSAGGTIHAVTERSSDARGRVDCVVQRMNAATFSGPPLNACTLGAAGSLGPDRIARTVYDAEGRVFQQQRAAGTPLQQNEATYSYSWNGQRTSLTDANGNRAEFRHDGHDRLTRWVLPSPTVAGAVNENDYEAYGYDAAGNRTSLRRRDGTSISLQYDALNRVLVRTVPGSVTGAAGYSVHYGYDVGGRQLYARFGSASGNGITYSYDSLGRVQSSTNNMAGVNWTLGYQYDVAGRRSQLSWMDGAATSFTYDAANRMTTVFEGAVGSSVNMVNYIFNARGELTGRNGRYGANTSLAYDSMSRVTTLAHDMVGTSGDQSIGFTYNPASQIIARTRSNNGYAFTGHVNVSRSYAVNGLNQYVTAGPASFSYDANGNLTSDGSSSFVYDGENRLVSASGAQNATLRYDPLGRLFETSGGAAGVTRFLYDGDDLVAEFNGSGTLLRRYVHGPGVDDPLFWYEGPSIGPARWLHSDHQGSIVAISDSGANAIAINRYDGAAGVAEQQWGIPAATNLGRFQYTGQAWIPELGMYHYKARIYSPTLGRFLQTDPIGYQDGPHLYAYVYNDPLNGTDPPGTEGACFYGPSQCGLRQTTPEEDERARNVVISLAVVALVLIDIADGPTPDVGAAAIAARNAQASRRWRPGDSPRAPTRAGNAPSRRTAWRLMRNCAEFARYIIAN